MSKQWGGQARSGRGRIEQNRKLKRFLNINKMLKFIHNDKHKLKFIDKHKLKVNRYTILLASYLTKIQVSLLSKWQKLGWGCKYIPYLWMEFSKILQMHSSIQWFYFWAFIKQMYFPIWNALCERVWLCGS